MNVVEFLTELSLKEIELWADGEQLRYRAPEEFLTPNLLGQLKEHKGEILSWLKERRKDSFPLSHGQQALWFLYELAPESAAYNIMYAARLTPELDVISLQQAAEALMARHSILRTTYTMRDETPIQVIQEPQALYPEYFSVTEVSNLRQEQVDDWLEKEADRPFDLEQGPVLRMNLLRHRTDNVEMAGYETQNILLLTIHHIAADLLSLQILIDELEKLYQAVVQVGSVSELPQTIKDLPLQYKDYVRWEAAYAPNVRTYSSLLTKQMVCALPSWRAVMQASRLTSSERAHAMT